MAYLGSFTKQPGEILPLDISFSTVIGGRTTTSITPTCTAPVGMTKVSQTLAGEVMQIYISGGTTATTYRWTVVTDIMIGGSTTRIEDEFDVIVEEV